MFFRMPECLKLTQITLFQGNVTVDGYSKGNVIIQLFPKKIKTLAPI